MSEPPLQIFPALDSATEAALRASIERFGVLVPVAVDQHGRVLDGHHRSRIGRELGVDYRRDIIRVESDEQAREIAATLNTDRRQLAPAQRREIVAALREQGHSLRAIAGAVGVSDMQVSRDLSGATDVAPDRVVGRDGKKYPAKPTVIPAKNRREADRGLEAAQQLPKNAPAVLDVRRAERIVRKQAAAQRQQLAPQAPLAGTFDVLCADPPWRYEGQESPERRAVENHYPTMEVADICALHGEGKIPAAADAILFLWATAPKLPEALEVMAAWDFDYRTQLVWVKDKIGMGYYARGRHELLLVGKRGNARPPAPAARPDSVIEAPRGRHSAKPQCAYDLIERMYPDAQRAELFAREAREGWTPWGNEGI